MTTPDAFRDAEHFADVSGIPDVAEFADDASRPAPLTPAQQDLRRKAQWKTRKALIDRLLRELDIAVYCELAALYYMDCTFILFALRVAAQLIFFTPKAPPFQPTRSLPYIGAIFGSNLLCILLHLLFIHPSAGEDTRGYLHGGLLIDFVGQKAPVSRIRLVSFDFLILLIHLVMLGLILERVRTDAQDTPRTGNGSQELSTVADQETNTELDHDAEERGVLRDELSASPESQDEEDIDRTALLADLAEDGPAARARQGHALDMFASGEAVILDVGLLETILDQWRYTSGNMHRTAFPPSQETTTNFFREHLGVSVGPDGRVLRFQR